MLFLKCVSFHNGDFMLWSLLLLKIVLVLSIFYRITVSSKIIITDVYAIGDEVLEWNGRLLQGATFEEVYNIIFESKPEPQVELVVSRPIG